VESAFAAVMPPAYIKPYVTGASRRRERGGDLQGGHPADQSDLAAKTGQPSHPMMARAQASMPIYWWRVSDVAGLCEHE
jgi:hypothetical protein